MIQRALRWWRVCLLGGTLAGCRLEASNASAGAAESTAPAPLAVAPTTPRASTSPPPRDPAGALDGAGAKHESPPDVAAAPDPASTERPEPRDLSDPFGIGRRPALSEASPAPPLPDDLPLRRLDESSAEGPAVSVTAIVPHLPAVARESLADEEDAAPRPSVALRDGTPWALVHERWGGMESTVLVVDEVGRVRGAKTFRERVPMVGVADLWGDEALEVVVEVIEGTALSSWPRRWELHRVTAAGKLVRVGSLAKTYDHGAKTPRPYFHNTVTMPAKGIVRVETTVFAERGPEPPRGAPTALGEVYELHWDPKARRLRRHAAR